MMKTYNVMKLLSIVMKKTFCKKNQNVTNFNCHLCGVFPSILLCMISTSVWNYSDRT